MKIFCDGGLHVAPIDHEDCLRCAESRPNPPCEIAYPVLRAVFHGQESREGEIHVSDITRCLRCSFYEKTDRSPKGVKKLLRLMYGIAVHHYIAMCNPGQSEIDVSYKTMLGRIDFLADSMYDWKTTSWLDYKRDITDAQARQMNAYAISAGFHGRMFVQLLDLYGQYKNRPGVRLIEVPHMAIQLDDRLETLRDALASNQEPPAEPGEDCKYCPYANIFSCEPGKIYKENQ